MAYVWPEPNSGCWLWAGSSNPNGYGLLRVNGRLEKAHRLSFVMAKGPIPPGVFVCHHCDNRACVNPDHLFLGSHQDNMDDMQAKGRRGVLRGDDAPRRSLSESDVLVILESKASAKELVARFGVDQSTISLIRNGKSWKHVPRGIHKT